MPRQWWHKLNGVTEDPTQADPTYEEEGEEEEGQSLPWLRHHLECTYHVIAISAGWSGRSSSPAPARQSAPITSQKPLWFLRTCLQDCVGWQTAVIAPRRGSPFPRGGEWSD